MPDFSIEFSSDIIYVAGYINHVMTIFQKDQNYPLKWRAKVPIGNPLLYGGSQNYPLKWRAKVPVAEDSLYHISLEMYDEAGNRGTYETTLEYFLPEFIYDRTLEDVERVRKLQQKGWEHFTKEEKEEWAAGMKGCLNTSDLKRIENAVFVIAKLLEVDISTNQKNLPELPDALYFQKLLRNVERLKKAGCVHKDTPKLPLLPLNTYQKINAIEHILHDIFYIYQSNAEEGHLIYCGIEIYSGESSGLL